MDRSDPQMLEYFLEKRLKNRLKNQKPVPERILALCKDPQVAAVEREDQLFKFDHNKLCRFDIFQLSTQTRNTQFKQHTHVSSLYKKWVCHIHINQ